MTEDEYMTLCCTAMEFPCNKADGYPDYCMIFQKRLAMCGLALVSEEPDPLGYFIQAPVPPPDYSAPLDKWGYPPPLTPEVDPWAWPVPSWVIIVDATSKEATNMHKHDKPVFKANDGTIFDTAAKAANHDAASIFDSMFHEYTRDGDLVPTRAMAAKWIEMRTCLNRLYDEFAAATKEVPVPAGDTFLLPGEGHPRA